MIVLLFIIKYKYIFFFILNMFLGKLWWSRGTKKSVPRICDATAKRKQSSNIRTWYRARRQDKQTQSFHYRLF